MVHSEPFGEQSILRFDHIAITVVWKLCLHSVSGLARFAVSDPVRQHGEEFRRIQRLILPEELIRELWARQVRRQKWSSLHKLRAAASRSMHDEDCIRRFALCIFFRLSDGPVMETQLWQRLARCKFKIPNREIAFRRGGIVRREHVARGDDPKNKCEGFEG